MWKRAAAIPLLILSAALAQQPEASEVRWATPEEKKPVLDALHEFARAVNARDLERIQALTVPGFDAAVEGFWFERDRRPFWSRQEDLTGVQVAHLARNVNRIAADVAFAEGFVRVLHRKSGDVAGDFNAVLVKREGKWRLAKVRMSPARYEEGGGINKPVLASSYRSKPGADGWIALFDGASLDAFCSPAGSPPARVWTVEAGAIKLTPLPRGQRTLADMSGIRTRETFVSFELDYEWKLPEKGNSGLKYRLFYLGGGDAAGFEYQMTDDEGDRGAIANPLERSGALYAQIAPAKKMVKPAGGEYNRSRLIVRDRHVEHWLNGEKVVEYDTDSDPWESPILFQNHGTEAWFRNIRIRRLDP